MIPQGCGHRPFSSITGFELEYALGATEQEGKCISPAATFLGASHERAARQASRKILSDSEDNS